MFMSLPDPLVIGTDPVSDPDPSILLSSSKTRKKNLNSYRLCFVTSL
jgi:hypothetical protein